ncbi:MAG: hypothetical protein RL095_3941 [Verrucomicrobiota bacterium]|jgi:non-ribosomal peptide synthetase component F
MFHQSIAWTTESQSHWPLVWLIEESIVLNGEAGEVLSEHLLDSCRLALAAMEMEIDEPLLFRLCSEIAARADLTSDLSREDLNGIHHALSSPDFAAFLDLWTWKRDAWEHQVARRVWQEDESSREEPVAAD